MNPPDIFREGKRLRENQTKDVPALSGKLIPEFDRRRNIRDMFTKKPSLSIAPTEDVHNDAEKNASPKVPTLHRHPESLTQETTPGSSFEQTQRRKSESQSFEGSTTSETSVSMITPTGSKRGIDDLYSSRPLKRSKSGTTAPAMSNGKKSQQSLRGFFAPKVSVSFDSKDISNGQGDRATNVTSNGVGEFENGRTSSVPVSLSKTLSQVIESEREHAVPSQVEPVVPTGLEPSGEQQHLQKTDEVAGDVVIDPIVSKENWSKLFTKRAPPRCEAHNEPCMLLTTKKVGINCGRSFWMCSRWVIFSFSGDFPFVRTRRTPVFWLES